LTELITADATDPMATVRNYIDAFSKSDANVMAAAFAPKAQSSMGWPLTSG
jgi:hypothetical protein